MHGSEVHSDYMKDPGSFVRVRAHNRRSVSFSLGCQRNTTSCAIPSIWNRLHKYKARVQEASNARKKKKVLVLVLGYISGRAKVFLVS